MKVREEIQQLSKPEDRPILEWLFERYHWASQWSFVATFTHLRYGTESYKVHRVWVPTKEGRAIYSMLSGVKCPECEGQGEVETGIGMLMCGRCSGSGGIPMTFDILIHWYTGYEKARLTSHSKWYRNITAGSLSEACQKALANHTDQVCPAVSMCWPNSNL